MTHPHGEIVTGNMNRLDWFVLVDLELQFVDEIFQNVFSCENNIDDFGIEEQASRAG